MSSSSAPVARAFLVVHVTHDAAGAPAPKLCMKATYSLDGGAGNGDDEDLVAVAANKHFCFPEFTVGSLTSIVLTERLKPEQYTFSLTEGDGSRTVGFCRRFLPNGVGPRYPVVMCILSTQPWFSLFFTAMEKIEQHILALPPLSGTAGTNTTTTTTDLPRDAHAAQFLRSMCARPAAAPGAELVLPLPWHVPLTLRVPGGDGAGAGAGAGGAGAGAGAGAGNAANPDIRFAPLMFHGGGVHATLALFAALVFERRVVFSGSDLSALSGAVHAANATLYPLAWQHIFLPLMPSGFIDYLTAPMPFLVGLPSPLLPAMKRLPCEEVFHLDLDTGEYTYFPEDLESLPTRPVRALQHALEMQMKGSRHDDAAVAAAFRRFFSSTLGPYRRHVISEGERECPDDAIAAGGLWLDQEGFVAAASSRRTKLLLNAMRGTQMYEVFVRERLEAMSGGKVNSNTTTTTMGGDVDFDTELADDVALSELVRAGTASAAAGTARAAAAARAAASYGFKKSAAYYTSFMSSSGTASTAAGKAFAAYFNGGGGGGGGEGGGGGGNRAGAASAAGRTSAAARSGGGGGGGGFPPPSPYRTRGGDSDSDCEEEDVGGAQGGGGGGVTAARAAAAAGKRRVNGGGEGRDGGDGGIRDDDFSAGSIMSLADQVAAAQAKRLAAIQAARSTGNFGLDWGLGSPDMAGGAGAGGGSGGVVGGDGGGNGIGGVVGIASSSQPSTMAPPAMVVQTSPPAAMTGARAGAGTGGGGGNFLYFGAPSSPSSASVASTSYPVANQTDQWVDFGGGGGGGGAAADNISQNARVAPPQMMTATVGAVGAMGAVTLSPPPQQQQQRRRQDPGDALAAALGMLDVAGGGPSPAPSNKPPPGDPFGDLLS